MCATTSPASSSTTGSSPPIRMLFQTVIMWLLPRPSMWSLQTKTATQRAMPDDPLLADVKNMKTTTETLGVPWPPAWDLALCVVRNRPVPLASKCKFELRDCVLEVRLSSYLMFQWPLWSTRPMEHCQVTSHLVVGALQSHHKVSADVASVTVRVSSHLKLCKDPPLWGVSDELCSIDKAEGGMSLLCIVHGIIVSRTIMDMVPHA